MKGGRLFFSFESLCFVVHFSELLLFAYYVSVALNRFF